MNDVLEGGIAGFLMGSLVMLFLASCVEHWVLRRRSKTGELHFSHGHYYLITEKAEDYPADNWQAWLDFQAKLQDRGK